MMKKYFRSLENAEHPLLGPNIRGLTQTGLLQKDKTFRNYFINFLLISYTFFMLSQFIELWLLRSDLTIALRNLSTTMLSVVCVFKAWTFIYWNKYWKDIIQAISTKELTQIAKKDKTTDTILAGYIRYTRIVTYFYWTLVTATVLTIISSHYIAYISSSELRKAISNGTSTFPEIVSAWVPFDKSSFYGYWSNVLGQTLMCFYGGGIIAAYDSTAIGIMTFFSGQLSLLKINSEKLFGDDGKNLGEAEALHSIQNCHCHHLFLIKYSKMFNSLLSPVMFLYVIICSLMICCCAIQITNKSITTMQQIWIAEYLMALIAQLFLYCWHGNQVLSMSLEVDKGVYTSAWWTRNVRLRRSVLLLAGQFRQRVVFNAGPFTTLTVTTFLAILKGSYSFYAILNTNSD